MSILVAGGAGYIGSHTCLELLNAGYDVVVIDNYSNSSSESLERVCELAGHQFSVYKSNLNDKAALVNIFKKHRFDAVIHFAGWKAVGDSLQHPLTYYQNNIGSTLNLCEVMQQFGVKKMIFSSSATVYGIPQSIPLIEEHALVPINPYGQTKAMIEQILRDIAVSDSEWSIALLRYFNPVGAHESGRIGEDPKSKPNNVMPNITQAASGKLKELRIFGGDYPTQDGTGVRDYIHVVDLAMGHVHALEKVLHTSIVEAYNLGTGVGYSVLELINSFEHVTGIRIPYRIEERRPGDVAICYADCQKAERELGWKAQRGIRDMCEDAWRWQSNNPLGYILHKSVR